MTIGAGLVEAAGNDVFHTTYVVAMPDGRLVRHRKLHAFVHAAIQSGSEYTVFDTPHGCAGLGVPRRGPAESRARRLATHLTIWGPA